MENRPAVELAALSELSDYRVSSGETDPRGWSLRTSDHVVVGQITDLIVDLEALVARYIVCSLGGADARKVVIPTGFARLDVEHSLVHLDFITALELAELPTFEHLPLTDELTAQTERVLTGVEPTENPPSRIIRRREDRSNAS